MTLYVERCMRFIEFKLVYTKLISKDASRTNRRGNKAEIVFSQHACDEIFQVLPPILLYTFINIREEEKIESKVSWITNSISWRWKAQCRGHGSCKILAAWQIRMQSRFLSFESFDQQCFIFDRTFPISMNVLPKAIPVEKYWILSAEIPKDHSNALVLFDTLAMTKNNVRVNILHLITFQ